jgi:hypothetical protein
MGTRLRYRHNDCVLRYTSLWPWELKLHSTRVIYQKPEAGTFKCPYNDPQHVGIPLFVSG